MIGKVLLCGVLASVVAFSTLPKYSTTAVTTLVGAVIKASQSVDVTEKYKRKDCPVCEGKGWYWSGDGIAKINCQYCEP
jgi:hypothetical protein